MNTKHLLARSILVLLSLAGSGTGIADAIFTVGSDPSCNFTSIQDAINAAQNNDDGDGEDFVYITNNQSYNPATLTIGSQDLHIVGGFASCDASTPTGITTISGSGRSGSVFRMTGTGVKTLENLRISNGSATFGGGIDFQGAGSLIVVNSDISHNHAQTGGGISMASTGRQTLLELRQGTTIAANTATENGGGIAMDIKRGNLDGEFRMLENQSIVYGNHAAKMGGGLYLAGNLRAYISAYGSGFGTIAANSAENGGGIAVVGGATSQGIPFVDLFAHDAQNPVSIRDNTATLRGGAIYVKPESTDLRPLITVYDYLLTGNKASEGAVIYADDIEVGGVAISADVKLLGSQACDCRQVTNNESTAANGGSIFRLEPGAQFTAAYATITNNVADNLIRARDPAGTVGVIIRDSLLANNPTSAALLQAYGPVYVQVKQSTIAGNHTSQIPGDFEFDVAPRWFELTQSIVFDLAPTAHIANGGSFTQTLIKENVLLEKDSLQGDERTIIVDDVRFVDPATGNYRLRVSSPAVDYAVLSPDSTLDLDHQQRNKDLLIRQNRYGPRDVGAYELQEPQNIVENGKFDRDLSSWYQIPTFGFTNNFQTRSSLDANGNASSGSLHIEFPLSAPVRPSDWTGLYQCIYLPGPGSYRLSGKALGPGEPQAAQDRPRIAWFYRKNAQPYECYGHPESVTRQGELLFPLSDGWRSPISPAVISVSSEEWSANSMVEIHLDVVRNASENPQTSGLTGNFDDITLVPVEDRLFSNGFE